MPFSLTILPIVKPGNGYKRRLDQWAEHLEECTSKPDHSHPHHRDAFKYVTHSK